MWCSWDTGKVKKTTAKKDDNLSNVDQVHVDQVRLPIYNLDNVDGNV